MIERPSYIERLERLRGTGVAKVLTGMRRAGKSGVLRLFRRHLIAGGVAESSIVFINLELPEFATFADLAELERYIRAQAQPGETTYVLIDEAQVVPGIARVVYALQEEGNFELYLTGSHARLVEHEFADLMSGRFVEIPVFPLSFAEYVSWQRKNDCSKSDAELFQRYLQNGGLPYTLSLEHDPYALHDYLDGVYHTVVRRDVTNMLGREDPLLLDAIACNLMDDIGEPTSANAISRKLTAMGRSCSDDTTARYLTALTDAYAFHCVRRYDLKSHTVLKTQERYYADDLGLRTLMRGPTNATLNGLLKNAVYLELRRRHREVYVGKHYGRHIDFVTHDENGRSYYQVAPSVLDAHTLEEELSPLRAERDNYPKTLLTLDAVGLASHDGIAQKNIVTWLLEQ